MQKENARFVESQLVSGDNFCKKIIGVDRTKEMLAYKNWIRSRVVELTEQIKHATIDPGCKMSNVMIRYYDPVEFISNPVCDVSCVPHLYT